jgi:hypothetical protein
MHWGERIAKRMACRKNEMEMGSWGLDEAGGVKVFREFRGGDWRTKSVLNRLGYCFCRHRSIFAFYGQKWT